MSENQETSPVGEAQQPVAAPDYSAQVELLKAKNQELIGERRADRKLVEDLQQQLNELQASSQKQKQAKLQEQGEYQALWKEASETNSSLQQQLAEMQWRSFGVVQILGKIFNTKDGICKKTCKYCWKNICSQFCSAESSVFI